MPPRRVPFAFLLLFALTAAAHAATETAVVTIAEGGARVLRGATWYKLAPGVVLEDADIVAVDPRAQLQLETAKGTLANLGGEALALVNAGKDGQLSLSMRSGWTKLVAKPPGAVVRTAQFDAALDEAIVVMRVLADAVELFVEGGGGRLTEPGAAPREIKRGEFVRKFTGTPLVVSGGVPKAFVEGLPRAYIDPLPVLASRLKSRPTLVADHEVTYAEAEPWLAGRDRAAFEKRFVSRLKDPAFRKAVEANISRYPSWDRILHPEKYQPKKT